MRFKKLIKEYPYKEVTATIIRIISVNEKQEHICDYCSNYNISKPISNHSFFTQTNDQTDHKYIERYSQRVNGIIKEDEKNARVYVEYLRELFEYDLYVKYSDIYNKTYEGKCHVASSVCLNVGDQVHLCYLIDDPSQTTSVSPSVKTIDEFYRKAINSSLFIVVIILLFLCFVLIVNILSDYLIVK